VMHIISNSLAAWHRTLNIYFLTPQMVVPEVSGALPLNNLKGTKYSDN